MLQKLRSGGWSPDVFLPILPSSKNLVVSFTRSNPLHLCRSQICICRQSTHMFCCALHPSVLLLLVPFLFHSTHLSPSGGISILEGPVVLQMDSARPRGEEEEERCLSWGERIMTWMMICARRPYCDVQICRGRWGRRVGAGARGALRGNRLIMLWVQRMFNKDVNENRRDYSGQKQSNLYPHTWNMQIPSVCFPFEFHNVNNMEERIRRKWQHQKKLSKSSHLCLKTI